MLVLSQLMFDDGEVVYAASKYRKWKANIYIKGLTFLSNLYPWITSWHQNGESRHKKWSLTHLLGNIPMIDETLD